MATIQKQIHHDSIWCYTQEYELQVAQIPEQRLNLSRS